MVRLRVDEDDPLRDLSQLEIPLGIVAPKFPTDPYPLHALASVDVQLHC